MPELPEVETTRRALAARLLGSRITGVTILDPRLRWPVPANLPKHLTGHRIERIERRAKYLLFGIGDGTLIVHLGMSGSLRLDPAGSPRRPHDHAEISMESSYYIRFHDPRRFGALVWTEGSPDLHPLLAGLGPEPFDPSVTGAWLHARAGGRRIAIKAFLMDSRVLAGIGNIYATEALFRAGIHPARAAGRLAEGRCERLCAALREVLTEAIAAGGTTLRDFVSGEGRPGYFAVALRAYGQQGAPCPNGCGHALRGLRIGQRSTVYCPHCQR